jgi:hypothetical protein
LRKWSGDLLSLSRGGQQAFQFYNVFDGFKNGTGHKIDRCILYKRQDETELPAMVSVEA